MGLLRSETMKYGTLVLPSDRAREFIDVLGRRSFLQFVDMNEYSMKRQYRKYIQRIDEMERILRFLFEEIDKLPGAHVHKNKIDNFLDNDKEYQLDRVEETLNKLYVQFVRFRDNNADLLEQKNSAIEEKHVLIAATNQLQEGARHGPMEGRPSVDIASQSLLQHDAANLAEDEEEQLAGDRRRPDEISMTFSSLSGVIKSIDQERFSRTLFRATRGNTYTHFQPIEEDILSDAKSGKAIKKSVFVVYYQGSSHSALHDKISKICEAFGVNVYQWPGSYAEALSRLEEMSELIKDKDKALVAYSDYFMTEIAVLLELKRPGGVSLVEEWRLFCLKEKAIYVTLNMFEGTDITLRADCWFPEALEDDIRRMLMSESNNEQVSAFLLSDKTIARRTPPTYNRTNEFSNVFQNVVDTYGVARYQEANPALLTMVTFPFLFGVMYGDIGHGACVLTFGIFLILSYNNLKYASGELIQMMLGGRYMILLMGMMAVFAGFMYNDFFSIGLDIFGTRWIPNKSGDTNHSHWLPGAKFPYPFGFDPMWKGATNELLTMNSFKMKFSVIVAFVQMGAGITLKGMNTFYFKAPLDFIFEFIPQTILLFVVVGYMDLLILIKWLQPITDNKPKLITTIIDMFMMQPLKPQDQLYAGQPVVQKILLALLLISVPVMLFPKPLILLYQNNKEKLKSVEHHDDHSDHRDSEALTGVDEHHEEEEEFSFGEVFIHQMIETIEFVLGTISNTASYLRLWALSLAHQQLSLVFLEKTVFLAFTMTDNVPLMTILTFLLCAMFACITFGVMLCMDSLECYLHALRLQWVEFQNKFYKADGYKFLPFSFPRRLAELDEE
eukprot:GHVQ01005085.1.p1 GENE.GHVQ01005085.1~~GHVQ01005085.1.p1  ORF type:complete len:840 (+),score=106.77 GHVQ01005085.1:508-3027(+)